HFSLLFSIIVFLSGIAGLSYELIWIRSIKGYFGCEIFSVSVVVSIYFAGMGLGGMMGSRLLRRNLSPLPLYALVEGGLALFGLLFPSLIKWDHQLYLCLSAIIPSGLWLLLKAVLAIILLIIPTTLIGLTLPLIAAVVVYQADVFTTRFSRFYGLNTFGAVAGCLLTGFGLIPSLGLLWAGRIIALINLMVSSLCLLSETKKYAPPCEDVYYLQNWRQALFPSLVAFLMGFLSLTYEVVWIYIFGFYFIPSAASLALLLSIFLVGLAAGSALLSFWKKSITIPQLALVELAKAGAMILCFLLLRQIFFQGWNDIVAQFSTKPSFGLFMEYNFIFGLIAFFLPALFMGMTFPLLERIWPSAKAGSGHVVGVVSAWNTWGGTLGAGVAGLLLIATIGSSGTLFFAMALSIFVAVLLLIYSRKTTVALLPAMAGTLILLLLPGEMNYQRKPETLSAYEYYREGRAGSVAILRNQFGEKTLYVGNTYVLGGTCYKGLLIQRRQGALPNILTPWFSKKVLKIGLGTGVTMASLVLNSGVARAEAAEIIPEVIQVMPHFAPDNQKIWLNDQVKFYEGDGREFLATSQEKYDVILGELYTPQFAGTGNLYSLEHLTTIKKHLAPNGVFCQWLQLSQFSAETFRIVVRTFLEVFGKGTLWVINTDVQRPIVALVASSRPHWSLAELQQGIGQYSSEAQDLLAWTQPEEVAAHFVTDDLWQVVAGESRINSINNPWIEELTPRVLTDPRESPLAWISPYRRWPVMWKDWNSGYEAWQAFGRAQSAALAIFAKANWDELFIKNLEQVLNSLPRIKTLDLFRAEILMNFVERVLLKQRILQDKASQTRLIIELVEAAVALDPANYAYRFNLWQLYQSFGQKEKAAQELVRLWQLLPEHLQSCRWQGE
ncbi:MAG: fused MFS/spermidine synthase, partial [candidate division KSB1 bacterium]|nr:fused MFS/spermidine synthase [candidate division KSB1 bacterium]